MPLDTLLEPSFDWALTHIENFGDTNLFPVPFEFQAIRHNWQEVRTKLTGFDLASYRTSAGIRMLAAKPGNLFRVVNQLDPLDCLMLTALVYECAESIEKNRIAATAKAACSYRINIDAKGNFFSNGTGWKDFHDRSKELVEEGVYTHVVMADIADFYNQAYHHRIENALEVASVPVERSKNIETFLGKLTAKQSRGLPVGPRAAIILAEACLHDVDASLLNNGRVFVRYVDDFRIFCRSRREAITVLHDLTEYLYTAHRLSLQLTKTKILTIEGFKNRELRNPEEQEENGRQKRLKGLIDGILQQTGYTVDVEEIPDVEKRKAVMDNLLALFEASLVGPAVNVPLASYVLLRATNTRTRSLYNLLFENLTRLLPLLPEVARYLQKTMPKDKDKAGIWGAKIRNFLLEDAAGEVPFLRLWMLNLLTIVPELLPIEDALNLARSSQSSLGIRPAALLARHYGQLDWVRSRKENWQNHNPWDRRAIVWAASILPLDERRSWLEPLKDDTDLLTRSVAKLAMSGI